MLDRDIKLSAMASFLIWSSLLIAAFSRADSLGTPVSIEDMPSIAQIEVGLPGTGIWTQQCVGVVLTSYHLVSIRTCFEGALQYRRLRAGTSIRGSGGQITEFSSANNHPDFDADITLLRVLTQLPLGDTIAQAPILGEGITLPIGLTVQLAGWGTTAEGGEVSSSQLYKLNLFVTDPEACGIKYFGEAYVTENHICIGLTYLSGRDFDARDMGDPLYYQDTLVGLLSYGKRDANDEYPIISTAISSYTSWIIANAV